MDLVTNLSDAQLVTIINKDAAVSACSYAIGVVRRQRPGQMVYIPWRRAALLGFLSHLAPGLGRPRCAGDGEP